MLTTRAEKESEIKNLSEKLGRSKATFVIDYKGMNVEQVTNLRKKLASTQSEMKVVRNTLAIRALKEHPQSEAALATDMVGTNAFVFSYDDASAAAKALTEIAKELETLKVKMGVMDGARLDANSIKSLATLPSKDALRAQLLGLFSQPATNMVRVLAAGPTSFLNVLNAYKDKKGE